MRELEKVYNPKAVEDEIYEKWEKSGYFNPDNLPRQGKPYSIVMPPPNVTGTLHLGHAVMLAIEDILIRYHRMRGDRTLWLPGTDHAAIATQTKVEKILKEREGKTRHDLGREKFLAEVENFIRGTKSTIKNQIRKMGSSCDWSREAYTLDEPRSRAVRTVFKMMHDDGLIYRGERIVNWDPALQTTVSDDEVEWTEQKTPFYYFKYGPFVISTARPETKFGDKYVVMHPDDKRYKNYKHGERLTVEWINGQITATVIKDKAVDMNFGTGVMTITPWHDAVDFEIAERHDLDKEQIIDFDGRLLPIAGEFSGMGIGEARPKIVEKLRAKGLVDHIEENYVHRVAINSRGEGLIEPQIKKQWFVDVNKSVKRRGEKTLKQMMREEVAGGKIKIIPERFQKTYFHWIDNLRDWNISRQIWFGHRVPVWYRGEEIYVGIEAPKGEGWKQDPDTLDTWFSSGLWTFSTLGWPEKTKDLKTYHPTSVLETGYDILFFWIARMILMTTYTLGEIPFRNVYLHGMVRDEKGKKMSKSLGNIIDPLDMIEKYGTDAVRLSLVLGTSPGNDMKLGDEKIAGFRNYTNKLWNASRFILMSVKNENVDTKNIKKKAKTLADKWILEHLDVLTYKVNVALENFDFSFAGESIREFVWDKLADWYLECSKIQGVNGTVLVYVLETVLKLTHPFMPFVTEKIWGEIGKKELLMVEKWPEKKHDFMQLTQVNTDFSTVQGIITAVRSLKSDYRISPNEKLKAVIKFETRKDLTKRDFNVIKENAILIKTLAGLSELKIVNEFAKPKGWIPFTYGVFGFLNIGDLVDFEKEKIRLEKELAEAEKYLVILKNKLENKLFVANAPKELVAAEKEKLKLQKEKVKKIKEQIKILA